MSQFNQIIKVETANSVQPSVYRLGFWASILTAGAAVAALSIAVNTAPARFGPFCMVNPCVTYPYTDAAAFVPTDYLWMYPAFLLGPLFMIMVVCIHHSAVADKKIFSHLALSFALIAAAALTTNYFIQLTVIQPSLLKGEVEGLSLFSQYNPHGVFIALEDIGYLMMSVAFLFAAAGFGRSNRIEQVVQLLFTLTGVLGIGALILALLYGYNLEYRYEVAAILINWIALIVLGALLSVFFWRAGGRKGYPIRSRL